jgi:hypothetical protein
LDRPLIPFRFGFGAGRKFVPDETAIAGAAGSGEGAEGAGGTFFLGLPRRFFSCGCNSGAFLSFLFFSRCFLSFSLGSSE